VSVVAEPAGAADVLEDAGGVEAAAGGGEVEPALALLDELQPASNAAQAARLMNPMNTEMRRIPGLNGPPGDGASVPAT
jgi:hypothetical protein